MNQSKLITRAELPNIHTAFGNIGNSWNNPLPNDLFIKGVPKCIYSAQGAGNVGTGLDVLFSFSFPAKTLPKDQDYFRATFLGDFGVNNDDKRLAAAFNSTLWDTGLIDIDSQGFLLEMVGVRRDATHMDITTSIQISFVKIDSAGVITASGGFELAVITNNNLVVQNLDNGIDNAFFVTGESATATNNNVALLQAVIELVRR